MSLGLSVSAGGSGSLVRATVRPFLRENLIFRASVVQADAAALGTSGISTGARLRTAHLIAAGTNDSVAYKAAAKDANGLWSEWGAAVNLATTDFATGVTEAAIGSGATDDLSIGEPSVVFPDLNQGSAEVITARTLVSRGFYDQVRRAKSSKVRASFNIVAKDLDSEQVELLHRFWQNVGMVKPFFFDYTDVRQDEERRYVCRFADTTLDDQLSAHTYSSMSFRIVEVIAHAEVDEV